MDTMSEKAMITLGICGALCFCVLMACLTFIAIHQGDGAETTIVAMMVSLPTAGFAAAAPIVMHFVQSKFGQPKGN